MRFKSCLGLVLAACAFAGKAEARGGAMTFACMNGKQPYQLLYDAEAGTLSGVQSGFETKYVLRSLIEENGTTTIKGYVGGRGTDFVFTYRYGPSITYLYPNGGKRVDECKSLF